MDRQGAHRDCASQVSMCPFEILSEDQCRGFHFSVPDWQDDMSLVTPSRGGTYPFHHHVSLKHVPFGGVVTTVCKVGTS